MRFSVSHETIYRYSAPVRLGDHLLRLTPRAEYISGLSHSIEIEPAPAWREEDVDAFGTPITRLGFLGETSIFRLFSRFDGEARPELTALPDLPRLPWTHVPMAAYLGNGEDPAIHAFARTLVAESNGNVGAFLDRLTRSLFERMDRHIRPDGNAHDAVHTLTTGRGACRDLAVLFMATCRSLGIPARFASGYQAFSESVDGRRHLHAWPEVWLPGVGWRGYDPTHGVAVSNGHVAVAAAPEQAATMPVEGGFWGTDITSTLEYRLEIEAG